MTQRAIEVHEFTCDGGLSDGGRCHVRRLHEGVGRPDGWIELPSDGPRYSGGVAEPHPALTFCCVEHFIFWLAELRVVHQGYGPRSVGDLVGFEVLPVVIP